jgi:hypothetical protein
MTPEHEPMVTLPDGTPIYVGIHDIVTDLLENGYDVTVSDGVVKIWPEVHHDCWHSLQSNAEEVRAMLWALSSAH